MAEQNPISERWNSEEQLQIWRKNWADISNKHLELAKSESRIDHRSHKARGIDEQPTIYEGISARIIEKKGGISGRCELNRQIKEDNRILREIKKRIKKLTDAVKRTLPAVAETLEKLRSTMIHCRYVINFADKWKTAKSFEATKLKFHCDDYSEIIAESKSKISERKQKHDKKEKKPPIKIFRHKELTQAINELSEQIEELRTKKNTILANLHTNDIQTVKNKITDIQKAVPVMERHSNESKTRLDNAQKEYAQLKEQAQEFDTEELQNLRYDIRPQSESETISELQKNYGSSFIRNIYDTAKSETDKAIGEADRYSVENYINKKSVQKTANIRRKQDKESDR